MKALFIIAHGSRVVASNEEVRALVEKVKPRAEQYDVVEYGFLELAQPSINEGLMHLINAGAKSIRVLPYFLVAGNHVLNDIPSEVELVAQQFPNVDISIAPYFGSSLEIADILITQIH